MGAAERREKLANYLRDLGEYRVLKRARREKYISSLFQGNSACPCNFNENPSTLPKNIRSRATVTAASSKSP